MTDAPSATEEPIRTQTGIVEHWCEEPGCDRWGCFGEPHGKETRWYCGKHRSREP